MRVVMAVVVSLLGLAASASAQAWDQFIFPEDGFKVDFPGKPTVTDTTYTSEYGAKLPARVYRATRGAEKYSATVVDYTVAPKLLDEKAALLCPPDKSDERACGLTNAGRGYWKEDMAGALLWATYGFLQRDAKLTHLSWTWQDLVTGHELQMTNNADQSRVFVYITMHRNKLYILEAQAPKNAPPPGLFQQSMGFVDKDGTGVRYQSIYDNMHAEFPEAFPAQPKRTGQGAAPAPAPAPATGR